MSYLYTQQKSDISDWHRADIVAALRKRGLSLRQLSKANGYEPSTLKLVLSKPWPKAEKIVANALECHPAVIWPSRYDTDGQPNRQLGRPKNNTPKDSKYLSNCNVKEAGVN